MNSGIILYSLLQCYVIAFLICFCIVLNNKLIIFNKIIIVQIIVLEVCNVCELVSHMFMDISIFVDITTLLVYYYIFIFHTRIWYQLNIELLYNIIYKCSHS